MNAANHIHIANKIWCGNDVRQIEVDHAKKQHAKYSFEQKFMQREINT